MPLGERSIWGGAWPWLARQAHQRRFDLGAVEFLLELLGVVALAERAYAHPEYRPAILLALAHARLPAEPGQLGALGGGVGLGAEGAGLHEVVEGVGTGPAVGRGLGFGLGLAGGGPGRSSGHSSRGGHLNCRA